MDRANGQFFSKTTITRTRAPTRVFFLARTPRKRLVVLPAAVQTVITPLSGNASSDAGRDGRYGQKGPGEAHSGHTDEAVTGDASSFGGFDQKLLISSIKSSANGCFSPFNSCHHGIAMQWYYLIIVPFSTRKDWPIWLQKSRETSSRLIPKRETQRRPIRLPL